MAQAISADFGHRSTDETRLLEIFPSLETIRYVTTHLEKWMKPERRRVSRWFIPGRAMIIKQPLGVVGIITPWNYPLYLAMVPLVYALAAGNRVMIKMSENIPRFGGLFAALIGQYFPEEQISVINGGPDIGKAFSNLPFNHLLFTGSTAVGRMVMKAAGENLTPLTLELGGKSPAVIGPDFPVGKAAERIMFGKSINAGQTCIAPDYVLLPENKVLAFVDASRKEIAKSYPEIWENPDYSSIINHHHYLRLKSYLQDAIDQGASIVDLNPEKTLSGPGSRKIAPLLILGTKPSMKVVQEEIFGPFLPVIPYQSLDEAIEYINRRPKPLALYYFDYNRKRIKRILSETLSGGVTINDSIFHIGQNDLPFGGVGASGIGHYHGKEGFETFSRKKGVFLQSRWNPIFLLRPPYRGRKWIKWLIDFMSQSAKPSG